MSNNSNNRLLITGAGVDRTDGIEFPLANTLLAGITKYLDDDSNEVDKTLRDMLPGLRFSFNSMIARAVDKIATREPHEQKAMVKRVQEAINGLPEDKESIKKHGELIIKLFEKLASIAEESQLDEETEQLIREVFPNDANDLIDSDSILDIHKLSLSDTFKTVLKRTLKMGLSGANHEVAAALGADMLNVEVLLIDKFLGFYNNKPSDIKNYIYISWALWAYLVSKQQEVLRKYDDAPLPFYGGIPSNVKAITLNYTDFLANQLGRNNVIYFHGGLSEYVSMNTRDLIPIDDINQRGCSDFIKKDIVPNIDVSNEELTEQSHVIPSLVPPLRLKPVLSNKYIDLWSESANWVRQANHIIVVGYSFNNADEHFNDILRCNYANKKIDIVAPEATTPEFLNRMEKVFGIASNQYIKTSIGALNNVRRAKNIRLISAKAGEVDLERLFESN